MCSFKIIYFLIFILNLYTTRTAELIDKRLCVDEQCSKAVSLGITVINHVSHDERVLSFVPNENVIVYSYPAGDNTTYIWVEISGKKGYVKQKHIKETNLLSKPKIVVQVNEVSEKPKVPSQIIGEEIKADRVKEAFEIVDGTKIPIDPQNFVDSENIVKHETVGSTTERTKELGNDVKIAEKPTIKDEENVNSKVDENEETELDSDSEDDEDETDDEEEEEEEDEENIISLKTSPENKYPKENMVQSSEPIQKDVPEHSAIKNKAETHDIVSAVEKLNDTNHTNLKETQKPTEEALTTMKPSILEEAQPPLDLDNVTPNPILINDLEEPKNTEATTTSKNEDGSGMLEEMTNKLFSFLSSASANDVESNKASDMIDKKIEDVNNEDPIQSNNKIENKDITKSVLFPGVEPKLVKEDKVDNKDLTKNLELENVLSELQKAQLNENKIPDTIGSDKTEVIEDKLSSIRQEQTKSALPLEEQSEVSKQTPELKKNEDSLPLFGTALKSEPPPEEQSGVGKELPEIKKNEDGLPFFGTAPNSDLPLDKHAELSKETPEVKKNRDLSAPISVEKKDESFEALLASADLTINAKETKPELNKGLEATKQLSEEQITDSGIEVKEKIEKLTLAPESNQIIEEPSKTAKQAPEEQKSEDSLTHYETEETEGIKNNEFYPAIDSEPTIMNESSPSNVEINKTLEDSLNIYKEDSDSEHKVWSSNAEKIEYEYCDINKEEGTVSGLSLEFILQSFSSDMFLYLSTTALAVILFLFGYLLLDKCKREGPLIARINKLEQQLLTTIKENQMLQENAALQLPERNETVPNEELEKLNIKLAEALNRNTTLEEQIQDLEKELDNSTEVGIELNRIISEMLNSTDGSEILKDNVENMQKKILEQQDTINTINESLSLKETEIYELRLELDISNKKVSDLQIELDKMVEKVIRIEEEKDQQQSGLEQEMARLQLRISEAASKEMGLNSELQLIKTQLSEVQRLSDIKTKEYNVLKESLAEIKSAKNKGEVIKSLLEVSGIKAHLEQFKTENSKYLEQLRLEQETNAAYATRIESLSREVNELRRNYEKADKEKVESATKLEVLNNYFKEKEDQMQKEIAKYESLWAVKEGEATSTTERIRLLQEELQNYKAQNESLKQEIINQEVELKSQISVLEKKIHDNWVTGRQTERKLEEAKQEAAQLRNRLTMKERSLTEGNNQIRIQSPLQQNGDLPMSPPPPLDSTISPPPPMFNARDLTMSPPIPGMPPPPFLPPPPGAPPFMPPPLGALPPGMPPFMPPLPHAMFPGDHRPPPLGRMSSPPPLNSRYSPDSVAYSEYDRYDRNSPSPVYDSEYGTYNDYDDRLRDDRRDYKRPQARSNGRNPKGIHSSGSENDSLGKGTGRKPGKKV